MTDTRADTLRGIINELTDRITAEPTNPDLPPLLAEAKTELATLETAEAAAAAAAKAAATTAKAAPGKAATAPAASGAPAPATAPATPAAAAPAMPAATVTNPPAPTPPTPPAPLAYNLKPAPLVARHERPIPVPGGNITADSHPSRLPPAARPTPN